MWRKGLVLAFVALGCAHYVPVRPEVREAGGVRGEVLAISGATLEDFDVRLTPAAIVPVGHFRLASASAPPCTGGDAMKLELRGFPDSLTLASETVLTVEASDKAAGARLTARDAVIDVQVGDTAASCLRLPVSGPSTETRWVSSRRWGLAMNAGFAWHYALSPDLVPPPLVGGLSLQRRLGRFRLGVRGDYGNRYARDAGGGGPAAGARVQLTLRWALAGELAYEFGGAHQIGFIHGPRASAALMPTRLRVSGFEPTPLLGPGVEIFGGYWFASDSPTRTVPWFVGAGLVVVLGP